MEQVSHDPPVFVLHDLFSASEVAELLAAGKRRRAEYNATHPLVCFQHDAYTGHGCLHDKWGHTLGTPGAGARSCLTQEASSVVGGALPASESLHIYRGQEPTIDRLAKVSA